MVNIGEFKNVVGGVEMDNLVTGSGIGTIEIQFSWKWRSTYLLFLDQWRTLIIFEEACPD